MIVAFQDNEWKILADFKMVAFQNPVLKIFPDSNTVFIRLTALSTF